MNKIKVRESNFELLRIFCMLGVLTNHVLQYTYPSMHSGDYSLQNLLRIELMNISIVAVNCFVMISGYFRIKQSARSFINLWSQLFFYCGLLSFAGIILGLDTILGGLIRTIFPFTEGGMWFMTAYCGLFLVAPILNTAYSNFNKTQRIAALISLFLVDIYLGYMHQSKEINIDGYHLIHFMTIYFLGMFLSDTKVNTRIKWGWLWLGCTFLMTMLHGVKMVFFPISIIYSMRYNSPMLFLASFFLFQWVRTWRIKSNLINWIAVSVLSVYIVHTQPLVAHYFFDFLKGISIDPSSSQLSSACIIIIASLCLYTIYILVDKVRTIITNPIVSKSISLWEHFESWIAKRK